jgi:(p)ppGpp synthase/HD superfamily hydrolase
LDNFNSFIESIKEIKSVEEAKKTLFKFSLNFNQEKIKKAVDFAIKAHKNQYRKSGEEYVIHPILVASITSFFSDNEDMIIAALLHDVVEDTEYISLIPKNPTKSVWVVVKVTPNTGWPELNPEESYSNSPVFP